MSKLRRILSLCFSKEKEVDQKQNQLLLTVHPHCLWLQFSSTNHVLLSLITAFHDDHFHTVQTKNSPRTIALHPFVDFQLSRENSPNPSSSLSLGQTLYTETNKVCLWSTQIHSWYTLKSLLHYLLLYCDNQILKS